MYSSDEISTLVNWALGYLCAILTLQTYHLRMYSGPRVIPNSPHFQGDPALRWTVIVREGEGAVGVKHSWTRDQLRQGKIPVRLGRFSEAEIELLNQDPTLALLPKCPEVASSPAA